MEVLDHKNVCRLCLANDNQLVGVFDKKNEDRVTKKVFITTGVEILSSDFVSQRICHKCYGIVVKIWDFRKTSIRNDRYLKKNYFELTTKKSTKEAPPAALSLTIVNFPPKEVQKQEAVVKVPESSSQAINTDIICKIIPTTIHPSISQLLDQYPNVKISASCLQYNVNPYVRLEMDQVFNYFRNRHMDFQTQVRMTLIREQESRTSVSQTTLKQITEPSQSESDSLTTKVKKNFIDLVDLQSSETTCDNSRAEVAGKRKAVDDTHDTCAKKNKENQPEEDMHILHDVRRGIPALVCNFCNAVYHNRRDLKRHKYKHSRCQFCKANLLSMERKEEHVKNSCPVKLAMLNINAIKIPLQRLEHEKELMNRYPNVLKQLTSNVRKKRPPPTIIEGVIDISDDEEKSPVSSVAPNPAQSPSDDPETGAQTTNLCNTNPNTVESVSIVKPEIFIRGSNVIDKYDTRASDIMILKDLIGKAATKECQTNFLDTNTCDAMKKSPLLFNNLQKEVELYSIVVHVRNGVSGVSCGPHKPVKKTPLHMWDTSKIVKAKKVILKKPATKVPPLAPLNSSKVLATSVPNATLASKTNSVTTLGCPSMTNGQTKPSENQPNFVHPGNSVSAQQLQTCNLVNGNPNEDIYIADGNGVVNQVVLCENSQSNAPVSFININVPSDPNPIVPVNINWPQQASYGVQSPHVFQVVPSSHCQFVQPVNQSIGTGIQNSNSSLGTVSGDPSLSSTVTSSKTLTILKNVVTKENLATAQTDTEGPTSSVAPQGNIRVKPMWELK